MKYKITYTDIAERTKTEFVEADEVSISKAGYLFLNFENKAVMGFRKWDSIAKVKEK